MTQTHDSIIYTEKICLAQNFWKAQQDLNFVKTFCKAHSASSIRFIRPNVIRLTIVDDEKTLPSEA